MKPLLTIVLLCGMVGCGSGETTNTYYGKTYTVYHGDKVYKGAVPKHRYMYNRDSNIIFVIDDKDVLFYGTFHCVEE